MWFCSEDDYGSRAMERTPSTLSDFLPGIPKSFCALVIYKSEKYEEYQQ
jgi:hypothetical protein